MGDAFHFSLFGLLSWHHDFQIESMIRIQSCKICNCLVSSGWHEHCFGFSWQLPQRPIIEICGENPRDSGLSVYSLAFARNYLVIIQVFCSVYGSCSPEPLTGHISGIWPKAQQRPVSQQHCIFVYWPFSSAAQRPLARAEKQMPTRWSGSRGQKIKQQN